jgi:epoxyqueuosine reductase
VVKTTTQTLLDHLSAQGFHGRILPIHRLDDLREGIEGPHRQGLLDEAFYQERLTVFQFGPPADLAGARSIIIVANPQPQVRLVFVWEAQKLSLILPPTYVYRQPDKAVHDTLLEALGPAGLTVARAVLPVKLLAVRSGLGRYGRNNVCYVPGFGSFHRLVAFYSDLPCGEDPWRDLEMMDSCHNCTACLRRCPTGAIAEDRFLLHAERCLTLHNERAGEFSAWVDSSWHNSLVGCLHCQRVCPENKAQLGWIEPGPEFSQQETALLLDSTPAGQLPAATAEKLDRFDLLECLDVLPRNLSALLVQAPRRGL